MLADPDPGVRGAAVAALGNHISGPNECRILWSLISMLDDAHTAKMNRPLGDEVWWESLPGGTASLGSVRELALSILTSSTQQDFGFDREAWEDLIEEQCGREEPHPPAGAELYQWKDNFDQAAVIAEREQRELLVVFEHWAPGVPYNLLRKLYHPTVADLFSRNVNFLLVSNGSRTTVGEYPVPKELPGILLVQPDGKYSILSSLHKADRIKVPTPEAIREFVKQAREDAGIEQETTR